MFNNRIISEIAKVGKQIYGSDLVQWNYSDFTQLYDKDYLNDGVEFPDGLLCYDITYSGGSYLHFSAFRVYASGEHRSEWKNSFFYNFETKEKRYINFCN